VVREQLRSIQLVVALDCVLHMVGVRGSTAASLAAALAATLLLISLPHSALASLSTDDVVEDNECAAGGGSSNCKQLDGKLINASQLCDTWSNEIRLEQRVERNYLRRKHNQGVKSEQHSPPHSPTWQALFDGVAFVAPHVWPGSVVLDVGAHLGVFAEELALRTEAKRVYLFEPVRSLHLCQLRRLKVRNLPLAS
jgi:hypothetical protein